MLLLTLPEKILEISKRNPHVSLVRPLQLNFDKKKEGGYSEDHIPAIETFLPAHLRPSTIMTSPHFNSYNTPALLQLLEKANKEQTKPEAQSKRKPAKPKDDTETIQQKHPSTGNTIETPRQEDPSTVATIPVTPQLHGELCHLTIKLLDEITAVTTTAESLHTRMTRGKCAKKHTAEIQEITTTLQTITAKYQLNDEQKLVLSAYNQTSGKKRDLLTMNDTPAA
jgi:hypothetical protein